MKYIENGLTDFNCFALEINHFFQNAENALCQNAEYTDKKCTKYGSLPVSVIVIISTIFFKGFLDTLF